MKKKLAIVTIIITSVIIWVLTAVAVTMRQSQTLSFTDVIQEAGSNVTYVKNSKKPVCFLPVGKECEFSFTVSGSDVITPTISIALGSPKAEPIYTTTASNRSFSTGTLNVDNKEIYIIFDYEPLPELDENKEYSVRYVIELTSGSYKLYNGLMLAVAALCIIPLGLCITYLFGLSENNTKAFDERQARMRGKAAMSTMITVIITALGLGLIDMIYTGFPLSVYESMMILVFIGLATFAITADRNDAYTKMKGKRTPLAIAFIIVGIIDLIVFVSNIVLIVNGGKTENTISSLVQGICCVAIGGEMIIKNIQDKKEALADEES